jgi:ankyrin repeat protein
MMLRKTRDKEAAQVAPSSANFLHEAVRGNRRSVVAELLAKETTRAHINAFDNFGYTPLHIAAAGGSKELVELLLQYGANPSIADKSCWTPLHRYDGNANYTHTHTHTQNHTTHFLILIF